MSLLVAGEVERVSERPVTFGDGTSFIEQTIIIKDWGSTLFCTVGRNFEGAVPAARERIVLEVVQRPYVRKNSNPPEAGVALTAVRRNTEAEGQLFGTGSPRAVKAV